MWTDQRLHARALTLGLDLLLGVRIHIGHLSGVGALWDCGPFVCGGWGWGGGCAGGGVPLGAVHALSCCWGRSLGGVRAHPRWPGELKVGPARLWDCLPLSALWSPGRSGMLAAGCARCGPCLLSLIAGGGGVWGGRHLNTPSLVIVIPVGRLSVPHPFLSPRAQRTAAAPSPGLYSRDTEC